MILAFNTLEEASDYLQSETGKNWTPRQIIQACLDYGIFPHIQILTDRTDLPLWMREGGVAELPFNIDLLSLLSGTGVIHIVRRDDLHYKIEPGLRCDLTHLRLSKEALNRLLTQSKQHAVNSDNQYNSSSLLALADQVAEKIRSGDIPVTLNKLSHELTKQHIRNENRNLLYGQKGWHVQSWIKTRLKGWKDPILRK